MKKTFILTAITCIALAGCLTKAPATNENVNQNTNQSAGLANPAAVYCQDQGGSLEPVERDGGMDADCIFEDGSRCPQWDYFREDCEPGQE